jgi:tetratricopeptide (TPR) repeat protein
MAEKQLTFKENEVIQILNKVYLNFKKGQFKEASELLEKALEIDFESADVTNALKCANFWLEREDRLAAVSGAYEKGEYYLNQWKVFSGFISRMERLSERCLFSIKYYIFGKALEHYLTLYNEAELSDPEILFRIGRCHKCQGNYENAIRFLELASQYRREDAAILAELADCYSLVNEERAAKVFFREAFFLDSRAVELSYLESPMILRLVEKLKRKFGEISGELQEWIPVYGTLFGLFNVKRELRPLELGKLKQAIYQLEKEIGGQRGSRLAPRLINHYFWLVDHYLNSGEDRQKIEEVLARIKDLDPEIYREYAT